MRGSPELHTDSLPNAVSLPEEGILKSGEDFKKQFERVLNGEPDADAAQESNVVYHDFSTVKKPTDNLEVPEEEEDSLVTPEGGRITSSLEAGLKRRAEMKIDVPEEGEVKEAAPTASVEASKEGYQVPEELNSYLDELIAAKTPGVATIKYFIDTKKTKESVETFLTDSRFLSEKQLARALDILKKGPKEEFPVGSLEDLKQRREEVIDLGFKRTGMEERTRPDPKNAEGVRVKSIPVPKAEEVPVSTDTTPTPEMLEKNLDTKRAEFVKQLVAYRATLANKKEAFGVMLNKLGTDKQLPKEVEPEELRTARQEYLAARRARNEGLFSKVEVKKKLMPGQVLPLKELIASTFNPALVEDAQKERNLLDALVFEAAPENEKEEISRGLDDWKNFPNYARVEVSKLLVGGLNNVFGKMMDTPATPYSGMRNRGETTEAPAAKKVDGIVRKTAINENTLRQYGTNINAENFDAREKALLSQFENASSARKEALFKKAVAKAEGGESSSEGKFLEKAGTVLQGVSDAMTGQDRAENVISIHPDTVKEGLPVLPDELQKGKKFEGDRKAFAESFDRILAEKKLGIAPIAIPFEGGKIHVVRGLEGDNSQIKVFLNGKEIGYGTVTNGKASLELSKAPGIKRAGWWEPKTPYQKAWEHVGPVLKSYK